jgi:hypothetical protein
VRRKIFSSLTVNSFVTWTRTGPQDLRGRGSAVQLMGKVNGKRGFPYKVGASGAWNAGKLPERLVMVGSFPETSAKPGLWTAAALRSFIILHTPPQPSCVCVCVCVHMHQPKTIISMCFYV